MAARASVVMLTTTAATTTLAASSALRIALVGDSLTVRPPEKREYVSMWGLGTQFDSVEGACPADGLPGNCSHRTYPQRLQELLVRHQEMGGWTVGSFGKSGASVNNSTGLGYEGTAIHTAALRFMPHVVVVMLGTNDAHPTFADCRSDRSSKTKRCAWDCAEARQRPGTDGTGHPSDIGFARHLTSLVRSFHALPSHPSVVLVMPPPIAWPPSATFMGHNALRLRRRIYPCIRQVADGLGALPNTSALQCAAGNLALVDELPHSMACQACAASTATRQPGAARSPRPRPTRRAELARSSQAMQRSTPKGGRAMVPTRGARRRLRELTKHCCAFLRYDGVHLSQRGCAMLAHTVFTWLKRHCGRRAA